MKIRNYEKNRTLSDEETNTDPKSNATDNTNDFEKTKNNINNQTKQTHATKKLMLPDKHQYQTHHDTDLLFLVEHFVANLLPSILRHFYMILPLPCAAFI